jgi:hypothetical protein
MQQIAVQWPISTVQCANKRHGINALILIRGNGNFVKFGKVLNNGKLYTTVCPAANHEGELV